MMNDGARIELNEAIAILERTPAALRALLTDLPQPWTTCQEGPDTFSAFDNVGHLIHGERADWIARARIILAQGENRRFQPFDRFAQARESAGKTLHQLLDEFDALRAQNIALVRSWQLTERELALTGEHPELGTVTLEQLISTWVVHDLGHLAQIARVMAKRYAAAVGPWQAYLPILTRK
jgi:hypothetical protein